jgi:hypothetical protein
MKPMEAKLQLLRTKNESMPSQPVLTVGKFKTVSTYNQFLKSKMTAVTTETTKKKKEKRPE